MKGKKDYNKELVKRGELPIDPPLFQEQQKQKKNPKGGRPHLYPRNLILFLIFLKFALRLPYRQTKGVARKLFSFLGIKVPNFRMLHYRFTKEEINLQDLPQVKDLPQDFVIVLNSTGLKVTNKGEWIRNRHI